MTREDIVRLWDEANNWGIPIQSGLAEELERFAALVAAAALAETAMQRLTDVQQEMEETHTSVDNEYTPVKPVAWQWLNTGTFRKRLPKTAAAEHWNPLYTAPPKRKPLTENQIRRIDDDTPFHEGPEWLVRFTRAIERAHGIGGEE